MARLSPAQTQMPQEGCCHKRVDLKKKKKCERDEAVGRDFSSMLQPLLTAVSMYSFFPLSTSHSAKLYVLSIKKSNFQSKMFTVFY
jgi:hypothetical protein